MKTGNVRPLPVCNSPPKSSMTPLIKNGEGGYVSIIFILKTKLTNL